MPGPGPRGYAVRRGPGPAAPPAAEPLAARLAPRPPARAPASPRRHHHIVDDQVRRGQRPRAPLLPRAAGLAGPGPGPAAPVPLGRCSRRRRRHVQCPELALSGSSTARPASALRGGGGWGGGRGRGRGAGPGTAPTADAILEEGKDAPALPAQRFASVAAAILDPGDLRLFPRPLLASGAILGRCRSPAAALVGASSSCHWGALSALPVLSAVTSAHMLDEDKDAFILSYLEISRQPDLHFCVAMEEPARPAPRPGAPCPLGGRQAGHCPEAPSHLSGFSYSRASASRVPCSPSVSAWPGLRCPRAPVAEASPWDPRGRGRPCARGLPRGQVGGCWEPACEGPRGTPTAGANRTNQLTPSSIHRLVSGF